MTTDAPKVPKQAKAIRDGVINPQNYNFNQLYSENFDALKTLRINWSLPYNMATHALGDTLIYQQWHSPSSWNIKRDFYSDVYTILNQI